MLNLPRAAQRQIIQRRRRTFTTLQISLLAGFVLIVVIWGASLLILFRHYFTGQQSPDSSTKTDEHAVVEATVEGGEFEIAKGNEAALLGEAGGLPPARFNAKEDTAAPLAAVQPWAMHGEFTPLMDDTEGQKIRMVPLAAEVSEYLNRNVTDYRAEECIKMDYSVQRFVPDTAKLSVIIIFCNEPKFNLLRTIHSVLNRTPPDILQEIILVDDWSDVRYIAPMVRGGDGFLENYVAQLPKVKLLRNAGRTGIVGARLLGIEVASAPIFAILDSHVEVNTGWAEPLVDRIMQDSKRIVMPLIDAINGQTRELTRGGIGCVLGILWRVVEHSYPPNEKNPTRMNAKATDYITSPTMAGGIFAAHRDTFLEMGGYDRGISFWGVENIELSFRWWQCGGVIECSQCSRVYHLFGGNRGYKQIPGSSVERNKLRVMAVWMDAIADLSWKLLKPRTTDIGDITEQRALRQRLKCKSFEWFIENVWPEADVHKLPTDVPFLGALKTASGEKCMTRNAQVVDCTNMPNEEFVYFRRPGRITLRSDEEYCLTVEGSAKDVAAKFRGALPLATVGSIGFVRCHEHRPPEQRFDVQEETGLIAFGNTACLAVATLARRDGDKAAVNADDSDGDRSDQNELVLRRCDAADARQLWYWKPYEFEKNLPWNDAEPR